MCGKCEPFIAKAATGAGLLSSALAVATRIGHCGVAGIGPRSFCDAAGLLFLLAIALNTRPGHAHGETPPA